ncbi:DUF3037 domain-containing protein [uncultured Muribaculum sp.]|uniref:DUF3037 domain-containing protein n=1 Tax=uncultured Muribaculum sp. TaxID=1918613 RepID=UPI002600147B|nr:DUF3037 domain-containing protein [uncultured Muribaculum sp.]
MHDKDLYEYAVIRYVPDVEREEFVNVGLLMMCKRRRWIRVRVDVDYGRVARLHDVHDCEEIEAQLGTFSATAAGVTSAGPMGELPVEERFRWLTAVKSASLQTSRPHPGFSENLDETFDRLFDRLVR